MVYKEQPNQSGFEWEEKKYTKFRTFQSVNTWNSFKAALGFVQ